LTSRTLQFEAPLAGEPVTFLHFLWRLRTEDQHGRLVSDDLAGIVKYNAVGELDYLLISGSQASSRELEELRQATRKGRIRDVAFDADASSEAIIRYVEPRLESLLGIELQATEAEFHRLSPIGEPDCTWRLTFIPSEPGEVRQVDIRVESIKGKIIEIRVKRAPEPSQPEGEKAK
jgi:hypothetical protein